MYDEISEADVVVYLNDQDEYGEMQKSKLHQ
jgi:hypothetical protein